VASALLGINEKGARSLQLDSWVPVKGYKRCLDKENGYEFLYPQDWLADQRLYRRAAARIEAANSLDPQPIKPRKRSVAEPTAAYGPANSSGEENVSVVVAPIMAGFSLEQLGPPERAADFFLNNTIAPPGSNKEATLVRATQRTDEAGVLFYVLEYMVKAPTWERHNVSAIAAEGNLLYTLNVQCQEAQWGDIGPRLTRCADSFQLLPAAIGPKEVPRVLGMY